MASRLHVATIVLLLATACGGDSAPSAPPVGAPQAPQWRVLDRREGETGFTLTLPVAARVRFRVEGAEKLLHT